MIRVFLGQRITDALKRFVPGVLRLRLDHAVDVQPPSVGFALEREVALALDPAATEDWVVLRVRGVHEQMTARSPFSSSFL